MIRLLRRLATFVARKLSDFVHDYQRQRAMFSTETPFQAAIRQALAFSLHVVAQVLSGSTALYPSVAQHAAADIDRLSGQLWRPPRQPGPRGLP